MNEPTCHVLDSVAEAMTEVAESPSALARKAKVTTHEAHSALRWLTEHRMAVSEGNGAWTKYRQRRFGE